MYRRSPLLQEKIGRTEFSSHLLIFSPDFFLRDGRRLYAGKGRRLGEGGGNMKMTGMLVVFLRGLNSWFWVSRRKANIFTYSAIALIKKYQSLLSGIGKWSPNGQIA